MPAECNAFSLVILLLPEEWTSTTKNVWLGIFCAFESIPCRENGLWHPWLSPTPQLTGMIEGPACKAIWCALDLARTALSGRRLDFLIKPQTRPHSSPAGKEGVLLNNSGPSSLLCIWNAAHSWKLLFGRGRRYEFKRLCLALPWSTKEGMGYWTASQTTNIANKTSSRDRDKVEGGGGGWGDSALRLHKWRLEARYKSVLLVSWNMWLPHTFSP